MNIPNIDLPRIIIIGAGFAGLNLAKKINSKRYQIVLIDKNNYHTFQPLMYQVASAGLEPDAISYPIRKVFRNKKNFYFRLASVDKINTKLQSIKTSLGNINYDQLVIATGAKNNFFGLESVEQNALPMKSLVESLNLRSKILENFELALNSTDTLEQNRLMNFVIVGGGPTGVELAGALGELKNKILPKDFPDLDLRKMHINLIEAAPKVLNVMSNNASINAEKFLRKLDVHVYTDTRVLNYDGTTVITDGKHNFEADTLIWAAGVSGAPINGLDVSSIERGNRIQVNEFNQLASSPNIYSIGDVSVIQTKNNSKGHPMLGSVAMQQGIHLAKNFNRITRGKSMVPFKYKDKGTMATIGRNLAVVDLPKLKFSGSIAWLIWMLVHLMLLVGFRNRALVFVNWTWNYFRYENGNRLIIRPFKRRMKKDKEKHAPAYSE